jgi:hypothetical protein
MTPLVAGIVQGADGTPRLSHDGDACVLPYGAIPKTWEGTTDEFFQEQARHLADTSFRGWRRTAAESLLSANAWTDDVESMGGKGHAIAHKFDAEGTMEWDPKSVLFTFVEIDPKGAPLPAPRPGMVVQAQAEEDKQWYNATITDVLDSGMLTIEWTTNGDDLLKGAGWFATASVGSGSVSRQVASNGGVRRRLATIDKRWGIVVRVVEGDSRVLHVRLLEPLDASRHRKFSGEDMFDGMVVEEQQFELADEVMKMEDSDLYIRNAGDIFVHDTAEDIYHGVLNLDTQGEARSREIAEGVAAQREVLRRRLVPSDDSGLQARMSALRERWVDFVAQPQTPFSDWWKVSLVDTRTKKPFMPKCGPCEGESADACEIVHVESRHGRDAHIVHPRIITKDMARPFVLMECHCKTHGTTFSPIGDYACDTILGDPDSVFVGAFAQCGSAPTQGEATVHEVLFTRGAQRLAWDSTAVELIRTEWSKSHSYRSIQRRIADSWANSIHDRWQPFVATLSPTEREDAFGLIDEIRGHLQMHLPSLESIKKLVLVLTVVVDKPFAEMLEKAWIGTAGTVCQYDVGHTGTQVISVSEKAPDGESNDAVAAAAGSVRAEREPGFARRATVRTVHAEVLNVCVLHGTSLIGRLVPSENRNDFDRLMLNPIHKERLRAHGANRGTCSHYATDHTNRDGQWLLKRAAKTNPAVYDKFGAYMAAFVQDLPHITRNLQEALHTYHIDAGTVKLLLSDAISRLLHPEPALTAFDVLLLQTAGALTVPMARVEAPSPTAAEVATLRGYVDAVDAEKPPEDVDTILGVYLERIVASGSLSTVPKVATNIFRRYIAAGLVQALPWGELVCVRRRDEFVEMAVTAFELDAAYVAAWVGAPTPPRLILNRFISSVMAGDTASHVPLRNHLDAAHLCAELGNIAAFYTVERALTKAGGDQLAAEIEHILGGNPERRETRADAAHRGATAEARRRITVADIARLVAMQAAPTSQAGVTNTTKFDTALQRLINPGNAGKGVGEFLLAHRLVGALAASMVQRASTHGTTAPERVGFVRRPFRPPHHWGGVC